MNGAGGSALALVADNGGQLARYEAACRAIAEAKAVDEIKDIHDTARALAAAARVAKNKQAEADMMEIRFRAERRIGELIAAQRDAGMLNAGAANAGWKETRVEAAPTLAEAGIDKNLADRARKYAAVPDDEFDARIADYRERVAEEGERASADLLAAGDKHVRGTFGTGENEWFTPPEYLALARKVLGRIDLDPASHELAQRAVKAANWFSQADDGLNREWAGKVWLNPPYAQPAIGHFADKMVAEVGAGRVSEAIMLTHNYTDTAWFQTLARAATAICFTKGRIRFVSPNGTLAAPTQGQAFFYFGKRLQTFLAHFREVGFVAQVHP